MVYMRKKGVKLSTKKKGKGILQIGEPVVKRERDQAVMVHKPLVPYFSVSKKKTLEKF